LELNSAQGDLLKNYTINASGEKIYSEVIISINSNPFKMYCGNSSLIPINHWIKPGTNTYSLKGYFPQQFSFAIVERKGEKLTTLIEKVVKPCDIEVSGKFETCVEYMLPFFQYTCVEDKHVEKVIRQKVVYIKQLTDSQNETELYKQILAGSAFWHQMAYGAKWSDIKTMFENWIFGQYLMGSKQIINFDINDIKMLIGKNSVYVYSGTHKDSIFVEHYLFKTNADEGHVYKPPISFVKYQNEWIVWEGT
jgi:hypothetical protein